MRKWRAERPGYDTKRYRSDPDYAKKRRARARAGMRKRRGTIKQEPCSRCGASPAAMHHSDYDTDAGRITWLCVACHTAEHYPEARKRADEYEANEARLRAIVEKYKDR